MRSNEYLAGLFDGEGSFSIQVGLRSYKSGTSAFLSPSMSVNLYYGHEVLDHFQEAFGGKIYPYTKGGRRWNLGRREALIEATETLLPYLEIKQDIGRRFLGALNLWPTPTGPDRKSGNRCWTPELAVQVAEIALVLNPARSRKSNKTAEYLEVLRAGCSKNP